MPAWFFRHLCRRRSSVKFRIQSSPFSNDSDQRSPLFLNIGETEPAPERSPKRDRSTLRPISIALRRDKRSKRLLLIEQLSQRQVLADVSGIVFEDINSSLRPDASEARLLSRVVYLDSNDNSKFDADESFRITDSLGRFDFQDLSGDESIIRLFSGATQPTLPLFPLSPSTSASPLAVPGAKEVVAFENNQVLTLAGPSVARTNLISGTTSQIQLPGTSRAAQQLADGRILVLASDQSGNHSFTISTAGTVTPITLQSPSPADGWADFAIDTSGNGVLVEKSSGSTLLRALAVNQTVNVGNTTTTVGSGTRVVGGGDLMTVISTPTDDGLQLRLWSNATGTEIGSGGVTVVGGKEVLSYDDESGLVLLRNVNQSLTVLDAAASFSSLQTIAGITGPAVIDPIRELLYGLTDSKLEIVDLNTANRLAEFTLNATTFGTASQLLLDSTTGKLLVLHTGGLSSIALDRANVHRIDTSAGSTPYELLFALPPSGSNTPPRFDTLPVLITPEDTSLVVPAPKLLDTASDAENDSIRVFLQSQPSNGVVAVKPNGALTYTPKLDFFGVDRFKVILHDGTTPSDPIELSINVTPVNDPFGIAVTPNVIPENPVPDAVAGNIVITNVDGGQIIWDIDDPRFQVVQETLIIVPGSVINYEQEQTITVHVTATEVASGDSDTKTVVFTVSDQDDPPSQIQPDTATIDENLPGELIAEISVIDEDAGEEYAFAVDDARFLVDFRDLRLKPGMSLDFEAASSVTVNITATSANGKSITEPLVITVRDIGEQASTIELSNKSVKELIRGAAVGNVIIDGNPLGSGYIATVNDARFEIAAGKIKLRSAEFVRLADQEEIEIVVTVQDAGASFLPISGTFILQVLANPNPFHNPVNPYDVNDDGRVAPNDALLILNSIRRNGGPGPISRFPSPDRFYDVNGDGLITPLDALLILNYLNRQRRLESEGDGEQTPQAPQSPNDVAQTSPPASSFAVTPAEVLRTANTSTTIGQPTVESTAGLQLPTLEQPAAIGPMKWPVSATDFAADIETMDAALIRDDVLKMLASDTITDRDAVNAAIDEFLDASNENG